MKVMKRTIFLMCLSMFLFNSALANNHSQDSKLLLKNLQRKIIHTLLYVSENEMKAGKDMRNFNYQFSLPVNQHINLGLVIGAYKPKLGYEVISVTPSSEAEKQGIKVHDYITEINHVPVEKIKSSEILNVLYKLKVDQNLTLGVKSNKELKIISPKLSAVEIPNLYFKVGEGVESKSTAKQNYPENSCAKVSVHIKPPSSMGRFGAVNFERIDNNVVSDDLNTIQLRPGHHQFHFARTNFYGGPTYGKMAPIEIEIKPNKRYFIATRVINGVPKIVNWRIDAEQCIQK